MIVGYGRERTTRDVDARIEYAKDEVLAAADEITAEQGLDPNSLNEKRQAVHAAGQGRSARTVFKTPGLVVTGASAEHMLAMKIDAARNSDEDDIGVLVDQLGDHERRSSTRDIPDAAAAHGGHRRAATGTRVEDRRREGEAPAVTESLVNAGHAEPPFRNCYSSPIHKGNRRSARSEI